MPVCCIVAFNAKLLVDFGVCSELFAAMASSDEESGEHDGNDVTRTTASKRRVVSLFIDLT